MQPSVKCKLLESAFSSQTDNRQSGNTDEEEEDKKRGQTTEKYNVLSR